MLDDDGFYVFHAAVAYFDVVLVENSVKFVMLGEVFVYELQEDATDVGLYILAVWRVVPDDVALSVSSGRWLVVVVGQGFVVSAGFQGVFVDRFCFVEFCLVAGYTGYPQVDSVW